MSALTDLIDAGHYRAYIDAANIERALATWSTLRIVAYGISGRHGEVKRRPRAGEISALKRAVESVTGYRLTLVSKSYSEAHGFMHASYFTYNVSRLGATL